MSLFFRQHGGRLSGGALAAVAAAMLLLAPAARAQIVPAPPPLQTAEEPEELENVGIEEKLGSQVPPGLTFVDEHGETVQLADYLGEGKPILLNLGYFECPMLCSLVWQDMVKSLKELTMSPGDEFTVLTVSFDPREGPELAMAKKETMIAGIGKPGAADGWHFLTGEHEAIQALTQAVGFQYRWVESNQQFAHPATLIVLTPEGKVTRYLKGVDIPRRTLRTSLVEASDGKVGSWTDQVFLSCFHYDPETGQYTWAAMALMRIGGGVTLVAIAAGIGLMTLRNRRRHREAEPAEHHE
ncbi:MAG: SCO family protein [Phycisphaeraceae bacterium]